jgi:hypothetical protein
MKLAQFFSNASPPLRQSGEKRAMKAVHEVRRVADEETHAASAMKRLERLMSFTLLEGSAS